jgi:hypothetical protein
MRVSMQVAQPGRADWMVRGLALAGFGGLVGGLVAGALGRLAMRIFAVAVGQPTTFTTEGSMVIVFFGLLFGPAVAVGYVLVRPFLPGPWPIRGLLYGLALAGLVALSFSGAPIEEAAPDRSLAIILFAMLALILGLVTAGVTAWLDPRLPVPVTTAGRGIGLGALIGIVGALLLFSILVGGVIGLFD